LRTRRTGEKLAEIRRASEDLIEKTDKVRRTRDAYRREELYLHPLDVTGIVREAVEEAKGKYPWAEIKVDLPDEATTLCDEALRQAVDELLENAVTHSDRDTPEVTVSVSTAEDHVDVSISDNGPGIPESERAPILEGGGDRAEALSRDRSLAREVVRRHPGRGAAIRGQRAPRKRGHHKAASR